MAVHGRKKARKAKRRSITGNLLRMSVKELEAELNSSENTVAFKQFADHVDLGMSAGEGAPKDGVSPAALGLEAKAGSDAEEKAGSDAEEKAGSDAEEKGDGSADPGRAIKIQRYEMVAPKAIRSVATGDKMTLFLSVEGRVFQCGTMRGKRIETEEVRFEATEAVVEVAVAGCGEHHGTPGEKEDHLALLVDRTSRNLFTWGGNDYGQLGLASHEFQKYPVNVTDVQERVGQVALGSKTTFCVTESNLVYSFGRNFNGELGLGEMTEMYRGYQDSGVLKTVWAPELADKDRPSLVPAFAAGRAEGSQSQGDVSGDAFGPWAFRWESAGGDSSTKAKAHFLKRRVHAGKNYNLSWVRKQPCSEEEKSMYRSITTMKADLVEISHVIEDKQVELEMLKPPQEQQTKTAEEQRHNNEKNVLIGLIGTPSKEQQHIYNNIRRDPCIQETVQVILALEDEMQQLEHQLKAWKGKIARTDGRIKSLAKEMDTKGENSQILWKLLESIPSRINRFGGGELPQVTTQNLKQLESDKLALLKGEEGGIKQQRVEMSALIKNLHNLQKKEAELNREIALSRTEIDTLTTLGRSHANALFRKQSEDKVFDSIDVAYAMGAYGTEMFDAKHVNERKAVLKNVQGDVLGWRYRPDKSFANSMLAKRGGTRKVDPEKVKLFSIARAFAELCATILEDTERVQSDIDLFEKSMSQHTEWRHQKLLAKVEHESDDPAKAGSGGGGGGFACFGSR